MCKGVCICVCVSECVCVCVAVNSQSCCIWIVNDITDFNTCFFSVSHFSLQYFILEWNV